MLFATAACNFSTSELPKVVRGLQFFNILTLKCAFRHSGVQFCDIVTSKNASELTCFVHFHFKMCFSPQRRAILRHRNFKKCFGADVFCTFSLQNVLFATAAYNFSTCQLPKVVRDCGVLLILTCECAFRHSGVQQQQQQRQQQQRQQQQQQQQLNNNNSTTTTQQQHDNDNNNDNNNNSGDRSNSRSHNPFFVSFDTAGLECNERLRRTDAMMGCHRRYVSVLKALLTTDAEDITCGQKRHTRNSGSTYLSECMPGTDATSLANFWNRCYKFENTPCRRHCLA